MPRPLQNEESLPEGVRRMAREIVSSALDTVTSQPDPEIAIHEFRKRGKEIRALLRLIRDEIGNAIYRRENAFFRDLTRPYSERRDRWVFVQTLEGPLAEAADETVAVDLGRARERLFARHAAEFDPGTPSGFTEVAAELRAALDRIEQWPFDGDEFGIVRKAIRRTYRDGQIFMEAALSNRDPEALHEWRKLVKYLWNQLELIRPSWEDTLPDLADGWRELSSLLGEDHDLAALREFLHADPSLAPDEEGLGRMDNLSSSLQQELQVAIEKRGREIYAHEPAEFAAQIEIAWEQARPRPS